MVLPPLPSLPPHPSSSLKSFFKLSHLPFPYTSMLFLHYQHSTGGEMTTPSVQAKTCFESPPAFKIPRPSNSWLVKVSYSSLTNRLILKPHFAFSLTGFCIAISKFASSKTLTQLPAPPKVPYRRFVRNLILSS